MINASLNKLEYTHDKHKTLLKMELVALVDIEKAEEIRTAFTKGLGAVRVTESETWTPGGLDVKLEFTPLQNNGRPAPLRPSSNGVHVT